MLSVQRTFVESPEALNIYCQLSQIDWDTQNPFWSTSCNPKLIHVPLNHTIKADLFLISRVKLSVKYFKELVNYHLLETHAKKVGSIKQCREKMRQFPPSLEQVHIVELVELHRKLHRGLDFSHLGLYRQKCLTSFGIHL